MNKDDFLKLLKFPKIANETFIKIDYEMLYERIG